MKSIAVVGTRHPSEYAKKVARRVSANLIGRGYIITSGLALGIDTEVHRGTLNAKGLTVAVLAHGLDSIHPKSNIALSEEILNNNGALISEHEMGTNPIPAYFALRDRIQSGLSIASIIIESGVPGGSIIQAKYTFEQNRNLFTIVRDPNSNSSQELNTTGSDYLINNFHATPIKNADELELYFSDGRSQNTNNSIQRELF